jgi:hypothetical protein
VNSQLRKEKDCLNCGAEISDRYCPHCGQENLIPQETVGDLVRHFISDIFHYDSKLLTTIRDLLFNPGFLTQEYLHGRRIRYLNPVRMYIFISFIFFLVLFAGKSRDQHANLKKPGIENLNTAKQFLADSLKKTLLIRKSTTPKNLMRDSLIREIASNLDTPVLHIRKDESIGFKIGEEGFLFTLVEDRYDRISEYDSVQKSLPDSLKNGFILSIFIRKTISLKKKLGSSITISVNEEFRHNVPKLMFVLLPIFALLLFLFYRKKKFTYAAHVIFSIHYHSFAFLLLLITSLLNLILPFHLINAAILIISLSLLFLYLLLALKRVYQQGFLISFGKALAIGILYLIALFLSLWMWALILFFSA